MCRRAFTDFHTVESGWSRTSQPSPPTELRPAIQSHAALPLTHYSVCVSVCVVFWVTYMWVLYSVCVCLYSVWLCMHPDTGPLCSPAGWLIRSYSNNQLYFTPLSLFLPTHSLCVTPPPPAAPPPPLIRIDGTNLLETIGQRFSLCILLKPCPY